jgi:hypothetical protein
MKGRCLGNTKIEPILLLPMISAIRCPDTKVCGPTTHVKLVWMLSDYTTFVENAVLLIQR